MARHDRQHPLGKVSLAKRLDIPLPETLKKRLDVLAMLENKTPTEWARDSLEKAIEGEWVFMQRRLHPQAADDDGNNAR